MKAMTTVTARIIASDESSSNDETTPEVTATVTLWVKTMMTKFTAIEDTTIDAVVEQSNSREGLAKIGNSRN